MARLLAGIIAIVGCVSAQEPAGGQRVIGVITEKAGEAFKVRSDAGDVISVAVSWNTSFRKVAPGVTDLSKAAVITFADVSTGDRVLARGAFSQAGTTLAAGSIVVISRDDLAAKQQRETAAWQNGIAGLVASVNVAAGEITVRVPSMMGDTQTVTVAASDKTIVRRYAPDSVRFADARTSTLLQIRAGDQLRARGEKSEDGSRITAEEIVTGSFRTLAATVVSTAGTTLQVKELETGKSMTVRLAADSNLRRFPEMPLGMAGRGAGAASDGPGAPAMRRGAPNLAQMIDRMPSTTAADLKPGETIVVSSTRGASDSELTAITLLAGAERFIAMRRQMAANSASRPQNAPSGPAGNWNLEVSIPMP